MSAEDHKNESEEPKAGPNGMNVEPASGVLPETGGPDDAAPAEDEPSLEEQLEAAKEAVTQLKDKVLRAMAETENVRRRAAKDKRETGQYAIANFARDMLPVADNLGRALDMLPEDAKSDEKFGAFIEGVELTGRELVAVFEKHGVTEVKPHGDKFDHNLHQAMFEVEDAEKPAGTITEVMQIGYTIGERLLRPAMVGVTKAPKPAEDPTPEATAESGEADGNGTSGEAA